MRTVLLKIKSLIYNSKASPQETSLTISIGIFWGLNPLIGTHFYLISLTYYFLRFFSLYISIGLAYLFSYILNPITIIPFFSLFYWTGKQIFSWFDLQLNEVSMLKIQQFLESLSQMSFFDSMSALFSFFFLDLGRPVLVGSVFVGSCLAVISYFIALHVLTKRKTN